MMNQKIKYFVVFTTSLLITQQAEATQPIENNNTQNLNPETNLISYRCQEDYNFLTDSQEFYEISTRGGDIRIRATPGGRIIGAIPDGWQVYVTRFNNSGRWAYIRDVYSPSYPYFWNAPNFNSDGWVSVDYLEYLGEYCNKPSRLSLLPENLPIAVNQDNLSDTIWHSLETEILAKLN